MATKSRTSMTGKDSRSLPPDLGLINIREVPRLPWTCCNVVDSYLSVSTLGPLPVTGKGGRTKSDIACRPGVAVNRINSSLSMGARVARLFSQRRAVSR